jgi:hypothetical protein
MKSAYYRLRELDTDKEIHQIVVYDETQPCLLCTLPVGEASTGGTAICGTCDCGRLRKGGIRQRYKSEGRKMPSVWCNVKESFEFPAREEANAKMYSLHQSGITGWKHVIEKMAGSR